MFEALSICQKAQHYNTNVTHYYKQTARRQRDPTHRTHEVNTFANLLSFRYHYINCIISITNLGYIECVEFVPVVHNIDSFASQTLCHELMYSVAISQNIQAQDRGQVDHCWNVTNFVNQLGKCDEYIWNY